MVVVLSLGTGRSSITLLWLLVVLLILPVIWLAAIFTMYMYMDDLTVEVSIVAGLPNCHVQQNREIVLEVSHYKSLGSFGAVVTASIGVDQLVVVDCIELVEKLPPLDCC